MFLQHFVILSVIFYKINCLCEYNNQQNELNCNNTDLVNIINRYGRFKNNIKSATIENGNIQQLENNAFPFNNLQSLHLHGQIAILNSESLRNLKKLDYLSLTKNSLSKIPNDFFRDKPQLETLDLSHNQLRNPTVDTFYYLNELKTLYLTGNRITNIDLSVLDVFGELESIYLNSNGLFQLELGVFDEMANLQLLDLSRNVIPAVPLGVFDRNAKLVSLNLGDNQIGELKLGVFDSVTLLTDLNISKCKLAKIPLGIFDRCTKLKNINLSGNSLKIVLLGLFDRNLELSSLDLSFCSLDQVVNGLVDPHKKLEALNLAGNQLTSLDETIFLNSTSLKYLNLSHNALTGLPLKIFQQTILEVIDFSYNKFTEIQPDLLNMGNLHTVIANNNNLVYVHANTFATIGYPLKYLDLRFNRLVYVEDEFYDWVANLERFEIGGNPWDCLCLDKLVTVLTSRFVYYSTTLFFDGKLPSCLVKMTICDTNNVDNSTLSEYYDTYIQDERILDANLDFDVRMK